MTSNSNQDGARSPDFLVFSDDWGEHPSSCQHIFRHIARNHRVLWVNTIGMRNPTLSWTDGRKAIVKVSKMFRRRRASTAKGKDEHVTVCQPFMLPGSRSRMARAFNARSVTGTVRALLDKLEMSDPIVVTTVPNASEYPELLEGRKVIYYCVDDFSLWPGLDADVVRDMEARLIERADCIVTVSDALFERLSKAGKPIRLLAHGVDLEMFSTPAEFELPLLIQVPKPRVGFFGLIDGRMDWNLVAFLAAQLPEISFVFGGPVDASAGKLPDLKNLHFIGQVEYSRLPSLIAGLEVLILPYQVGKLSDALSPLKLKEYIASGKQVISAPIAQAEKFSKILSVARTRDDWLSNLRHLGKVPGALQIDARARAMTLLERESWQHKAHQLLELCELYCAHSKDKDEALSH